MEEKNRLRVTMLEAVYLDLVAGKSVVGIVPNTPFRPLFESLLEKPGASVRVYKSNLAESDASPLAHDNAGEASIVSWWRRGRVELPVQ